MENLEKYVDNTHTHTHTHTYNFTTGDMSMMVEKKPPKNER